MFIFVTNPRRCRGSESRAQPHSLICHQSASVPTGPEPSRSRAQRLFLLLWLLVAACEAQVQAPRRPPALGQWIWTRADLARFSEARAVRPDLQAATFIGAVQCDTASRRLTARAALSPGDAGVAPATVVIRFEDGLDRCRTAADTALHFNRSLDSAVLVLRTRGAGTPIAAVQLDHDAPQRALGAWSASVRYLARHSLATDSIWVTSLVAHLREPAYGDLFRDVVRGHVLQLFDTGEAATPASISEAIRLTTRARMPFRLGLGAFERDTRQGRTEHRAWFATAPRFALIDGYRGLWVFPAGRRWLSFLHEAA